MSDIGPWEMVLDQEFFEYVKEDERFTALLNLARALNAIWFTQIAYLNDAKSEGAAGTRQRVNAFLVACGAAYEALRVVDRIAKHFKDEEFFKDGFGELLKEKRYRRLRDEVLNRIRNKVAFHFDPGVASRTLKTLDLEKYVFAAGEGKKRGLVYYDLADAAAINFVLDGLKTYSGSEKEILNEIIKDLSDLIGDFMGAGEKLIEGALDQLEGELEGRANGR